MSTDVLLTEERLFTPATKKLFNEGKTLAHEGFQLKHEAFFLVNEGQNLMREGFYLNLRFQTSSTKV